MTEVTYKHYSYTLLADGTRKRYNTTRKHIIKTKQHIKPTEEQIQKIIYLHKHGVSVVRLSHDLHLAASAVNKVIQSYDNIYPIDSFQLVFTPVAIEVTTNLNPDDSQNPETFTNDVTGDATASC